MESESLSDLEIPDAQKRYIADVLNPVLEEVVADLLASLPADPGTFIMKWFMKKYGVIAVGEHNQGERLKELFQENERLKQELSKMENNVKHATEMVWFGMRDGNDMDCLFARLMDEFDIEDIDFNHWPASGPR